MTSDAPARTIPGKRRNGKLQSCEPCRRRKLSCDHRLPACGRCIKRGHSSSCYYHPAPMTKYSSDGPLSPSSSSAASPSIGLQSSATRSRNPPVVQSPVLRPEPPYFLEQRLRGVIGERYSSSAGILMETSTVPTKTGFLGDIASTAFVEELNNSLGVRSEKESQVPKNMFLSEADGRNGVEVIRFFQDTQSVRKLLDRWLDVNIGSYFIFDPVYRAWLVGMESFFADARLDKMPDKLDRRALAIWRNSQRPLICHGAMSVQEWTSQSTGDNLRWETLGFFLCVIARVTTQLSPWDPIFTLGRTSAAQKNELLKETSHLINLTVDLSKKSGSRNDLLAYLLFEAAMTESLIQGDFQSDVWTAFGQVCNLLVSMGLHLEKKVDASTPFWLCELRRRFFNAVYSSDKFLSTYLGRPPHLSYRFCAIQEPQDLSDDEICGDEYTRASALAQLSDGWTTTGHPMRSTWRKAFFKRYQLREDIMEVLIGPFVQDLEARIRDIRVREKEAYEAMPAFCRQDPEELLSKMHSCPSIPMPGRDGAGWRPIDVICLLALHFHRRHNDFLLERVLVNRRKTDPARLFAVAQSLLGLMLKAYDQRDFLCNFRIDFSDMLAFYAVPAAGVLAMELMKPRQSVGFPRSEVLQQLSILVPALGSVRPGEGNYGMCVMGMNAIKRVLDRVLSGPRQATSHEEIQEMSYFGGDFGNDADFLQWLGSVDFDSSSLLDPLSTSSFWDQSTSIMQATTI